MILKSNSRSSHGLKVAFLILFLVETLWILIREIAEVKESKPIPRFTCLPWSFDFLSYIFHWTWSWQKWWWNWRPFWNYLGNLQIILFINSITMISCYSWRWSAMSLPFFIYKVPFVWNHCKIKIIHLGVAQAPWSWLISSSWRWRTDVVITMFWLRNRGTP